MFKRGNEGLQCTCLGAAGAWGEKVTGCVVARGWHNGAAQKLAARQVLHAAMHTAMHASTGITGA